MELSGVDLVLYHGTTSTFEEFDASQSVDGGFHFGTLDQACMRAGPRRRVIEVRLKVCNASRYVDTGSGWKDKIRAARDAGHDAIVYLNRYEGLSTQTVQRAFNEHVDLGRLSDSEFRERAPEAQDSWIVFEPSQIEILRVIAEPRSPRARR